MERTTRRTFLSTGTAIVALLAGCTGGDQDPEAGAGDGGDAVVEMTDDFNFVPSTVEISAGETVTWENPGSIVHTVTADENEIPEDAEYFASGGFDSEQAARDAYEPGDPESGEIQEGGTYSHTFETVGRYGYFCILHEETGMKGTVDVTGS